MRRGQSEISLVNAILAVGLAALVSAFGVPVIQSITAQAKLSSLQENVRCLRTQIELYKAQHGGRPPIVYEGSLPQLIRATDSNGRLGDPGRKFPFGPYLSAGVPVNPYTGRSIVVTCDQFPPTGPTGNGGWLYQPSTGQIAPDIAEHLND
jgi:general secretion pathway protein G